MVAAPQSNNLESLTLEGLHDWELEDAKAKFSEVVNLARNGDPQRITVRGEDSVVILSAKDFKTLISWQKQPSLHTLLSNSPLNRLEF